VRRVQLAAIATDPNYPRGYRGLVPDPTPDSPSSDEVVAEEVALPAEVVQNAPTAQTAHDSTPTQAPVVPVPIAPEATGYTPDGVPTFDYARERIETRLGTALGASELAAETPEGRSVEEQYEARQRAAAEKLEQIRASMRDESGHA
jgi:hypothetical protein